MTNCIDGMGLAEEETGSILDVLERCVLEGGRIQGTAPSGEFLESKFWIVISKPGRVQGPNLAHCQFL